MLEINHLNVTIGGRTILSDISFSVLEKQWLMIAGPNGAGKSTIVNAISKGISYMGDIFLEGTNLLQLKPYEIAKKLGFLMQNHYVGYSFTVEEVVKLGRYAYSGGLFSKAPDKGREKIKKAMQLTGMYDMREQSVLTLSGGELQRTFLAQLLAQNPKLLILDEPANHLDLVYQKQVFGIVKDWILETGGAVISVVHDLSLAKAYGTHAILIKKGNVVAQGSIEEVLTNDNLQIAYSMDVQAWMKQLFSYWI